MRVPRKHDRHAPRSWFGLFVRMGGWVAIAGGVVLVVVTGLGAGFERRAAQFERDGRVATAEITDRRVEVSTDADGDESRAYYVTFQFRTLSGETIEVERNVGFGFYRDNPVGQSADIRYLASRPQAMEYYIGEKEWKAWVAILVGSGVGTVGLIALWYAGRRANAGLMARRDGISQVATVLGVQPTGVEINDRPQARLVWRGPDGLEGKSLMHDEAKLNRRYRSGDRITVFRHGDEVWWEGDVGPRRGRP